MLKFLIPLAIATFFIHNLAQAQADGPARDDRRQAEERRDGATANRWSHRAPGSPRSAPHPASVQHRATPPRRGGIDAREARQSARIRYGIASGALTRGEARRLTWEHARIERIEQRYRADGRFSARERADIQRRLDRSGKRIARETHDRQRRVVSATRGHHDAKVHRPSARSHGAPWVAKGYQRTSHERAAHAHRRRGGG